MSATFLTTLEVGEQTLHCHGTATRGEPAQTWGPPERCHEGSPDEIEVERVFLEVSLTEDLGIGAPARKAEIDITDLLVELGVAEKIDELVYAKIADSIFADDGDGDPDEYDPD